MKQQIFVILITFSALAGCATTPLSPPQKIPLPEGWRAGIAHSPTDDARREPPLVWWRQFCDPNLDLLITQSMERNADIAIAAARVQQAQAQLNFAAAERRPNVSLGGNISRERLPSTRTHDVEGERVRVAPDRKNQFATQFRASYEVDLWGRLALAKQASHAELVASHAEIQAVHQLITYEVVVAHLGVRHAEALLPLAGQARDLAAELLAIERSRHAAGLVPSSSVRQVEDEVANTQNALAEIGRDQAIALARLALLLGEAPAMLAWKAQDGSPCRDQISGFIEADLPISVIDRRPDVNAAWHRLIASTAEGERARLEKYPELTLTGTVGWMSETFRRWLTHDAITWVAEVAMQMPLIDAGRHRAKEDAAAARRSEREAEYRKTVFQALQDVEIALNEAGFARTRLNSATVTQSHRNADVSQMHERRRHGLEGRFALIRAELAQIDATQSVTIRQHELVLAWAATQKALGR